MPVFVLPFYEKVLAYIFTNLTAVQAEEWMEFLTPRKKQQFP